MDDEARIGWIKCICSICDANRIMQCINNIYAERNYDEDSRSIVEFLFSYQRVCGLYLSGYAVHISDMAG